MIFQAKIKAKYFSIELGPRRRKRTINNGGGDEGRFEGNSTDNDEFEPSRQDGRRIESEADAADQVGSNLVTEKVIGENSDPVEASKEPSSNDPKAVTEGGSSAVVAKGQGGDSIENILA